MSSSRARSVLVIALFSIAAAVHPPFAKADDESPKVRAERLFLRGKDLMASQHYEQACVAFDESLRIDHAGGTVLNLGECYAALGRFASSEKLIAEAQALAEAAHRDDAAAFAAKRLAEIAPRVDHLRIRMPASAPSGYAILFDGRALDQEGSEIQSDIAVDAGSHVILTSAPGYIDAAVRFDIEGEHAAIVIDIPVLVAVEKKAVAKREPAIESRRPAQWTVGWSVGSVGVGALVVGAALGGAAIATWHDADKRCPQKSCADREGVDAATRAKTLADGSTVALGVGAAASALGLVLVLTTPRQPARTQIRVGARALHVEGSF